jgi:endonuclease YncB( thermonuclease family)
MANLQRSDGRGFDRSYKRGAIMGLTVAEAFILLSFCLLLLFTWWQVDTEQKSLIVADRIADFSADQKAAIVAGLSDGSFDVADALRKAGVDLQDPRTVEDIAAYSRFMREEDLKRLMAQVVKLSPTTRLSLADAVDVTDEAALRLLLDKLRGGDSTADLVATRLQDAARAQGELVSLLNQRLGGTIRAKGGSIDARGTITLPQAVLFDIGQDRIKNTSFLTEICSSWLDTMRQSGLNLSDLKIEGHASSEGAPGQTPELAYLYNLDLSQRRAKSALSLCLDGVSDPAAREWSRQHLAAIGYSSARLIYAPDGTEDRDASRRVMFSVALNQENLIEEIKRDVATTSITMAATGPARVIDGDTIDIDGTAFRLSGIDAPEMGQPCVSRVGVAFDCGEVARRGLEEAVAGREVACKADTVDIYRRPVALCTVAGTDLAEIMIVDGFAVPFREYSNAYVPQGEAAQANSVGVWSTAFEMPWDYRKSQ